MGNIDGALFAFVILFILFLMLCAVIFLVLSIISLVRTMSGHACKTRGIVFLVLANVCAVFSLVHIFVVPGLIALAVLFAADAVMIILFWSAGKKA